MSEQGGRGVNIGPLERGISLAVGAALGAWALRRRDMTALPLGLAGALCLYRGATGHSHLYRSLGITDSEVGRTVHASSQVTIQTPAREIFELLSDPPALARHSKLIERVGRRTQDRWRIRTGSRLTGELDWEVELKSSEPNERLSWCSTSESRVAGAVEFRLRETDRGTELYADGWFVPPVPVVSALFNRAERSRPLTRAGLTPSQILHHELRRLQQALEAGETATTRGQPSGRARRRGQRSSARSHLQPAGGLP